MKKYLLLLTSFVMLPLLGFAQGTTSGSIEGTVFDTQGETVPGANVVAIHEPTGSRYGAASRANGRYTLNSVRVGGPYTVQVTFVGYNAQKKEISNIELGETVVLDFELEQGSLELDEIAVTAQVDPVFSADRTGAKTNISREEIDRTPTLTRSIEDFTRLTPQANGSGSFGGTNDRLNNLLVDGATLNDVFGLGEGTPGSSAGVESPISIDAIQEFNVDLAPYEVTNNNFNGAQINAITRSGSNEFTGSVYYQLRNENFAGNFVREDGEISDDVQDFSEQFVGIRLGGPIIEDKLFFFVNAELKRESAPLNTGIEGSGQANIFPADQNLFNDISNIFQDEYGYNPGGVSPISQRQDNDKVLAKLDWNINQDNKFVFRYNFVDATDEDGIGRGRFSYDFSNRQYNFNSTQNSFVAELNSTLSDNTFNQARLVYTRIRDSRDVVDQPFPQVEVSLRIADEFRSINAGIDRFSQANALEQDLIEFTDNFTYVSGDHELTLGTSNQFFGFNNLFVQDDFGTYEFRSLEDLRNGNPFEYRYSFLQPDGNRRAEFDGIQLGFYAQDQWKASNRLTLTGGLRIDIPILPDEPTFNPNVPGAFPTAPNATTDRVASGNILWSPRLAFNYDASSDETSTQFRGGVGIFSGPPPFVFISNQYSNTGVDFGRVDINDFNSNALGDGFFSPDPNDQPSPLNPNSQISGINTSEINLISEDFKYPQSLKFNLAVDQELPLGITGTLEGIYSKSINAVVFRNVNLEQVGTTIYGRPLYGDVFLNSRFGNASGNPARIDENFTNAILLENTDEGYNYTLTGELQKQFATGLGFNVSYTYNRAESVNNGTSSRAISNWQFNENKDVNNPRLGTADFELRHRILAQVSYKFDYADRFATSISLIYDGRAGTPFGWIYNGNANGDTRFDNDLVYVPASASEVIIADDSPGTYGDLDDFISSRSSLSDFRGEVVPRGTEREPWTNLLDLRINQEIRTFGGQTLEFTASMFNVLNFINEEWGKREFVGFNNFRAWTLQEYDDATGKPIISFDPEDVTDENLFRTSDVSSRWRLQLGARYSF
jgi:hypothetical protein